MPAGKAHLGTPAATSVVYGWSSWRVSQRVTISPLDRRPVVSSCYPCHPTPVVGTWGVLVAGMCQSTRSRVICSHWSVPNTVHSRWAKATIAGATRPPSFSLQGGIDLRHVNLENKFWCPQWYPIMRATITSTKVTKSLSWRPGERARRKELKGFMPLAFGDAS